MSVWFAIPSCRALNDLNQVLAKWKKQAYQVALLRQGEESVLADLQFQVTGYLGWGRSTNILAKEILRCDERAEWIIGGGDDTWPDPSFYPSEISEQCFDRFKSTWGVMQPIGDRFGDIDNIAGSPWMGREWCERAYLGHGPMFDGYWHLQTDAELCLVAEKMGVYWRRPDLVHYHDHVARAAKFPWQVEKLFKESHLAEIYGEENMRQEKALYEKRKALGFPGCEPWPR